MKKFGTTGLRNASGFIVSSNFLVFKVLRSCTSS